MKKEQGQQTPPSLSLIESEITNTAAADTSASTTGHGGVSIGLQRLSLDTEHSAAIHHRNIAPLILRLVSRRLVSVAVDNLLPPTSFVAPPFTVFFSETRIN